METQVTIHGRKRSRPSDQRDTIQLYRPPNIPSGLHEFLERKDLTEDEILTYISTGEFQHGSYQDPKEQEQMEAYNKQVQAYRERRVEIQRLLQKVRTGAARVDEDGRLVEVVLEASQPPAPVRPAANNPQPPPLPLPPLQQPFNNLLENPEEEERRWVEAEEREAAAAIARAIERYRQQGVALEEDLQLVQVRPQNEAIRNLTFRRICFAVLAVVSAFVCIMIQTMPSVRPDDMEELRTMDPLLYQILHVRTVEEHELHCPGLDRVNHLTWGDRLRQLIRLRTTSVDCSDGVLHIPPTEAMKRLQLNQKTWFFPCQPVSAEDHLSETNTSISCYPAFQTTEMPKDACVMDQDSQPKNLCFRGIHDDFLTSQQTNDALRMGATLISLGGDHFDLHYDLSVLESRVPSILAKLRTLLTETYLLPSDLRPVAFRVSAVAPMDGDSVPLYGIQAATHPLVRLLNRTRYLRWMHESMQHNEYVAQYYSWLPWPFHTSLSSANRDTCNLMADMQADPRFSILTSIFLSDGAGRDFRGGVSLFVDDEKYDGGDGVSKSFSRKKRPSKIRRGLTIDGSRGRLVVSTGGLENQRCRLPIRSGIRAALQIWWNC